MRGLELEVENQVPHLQIEGRLAIRIILSANAPIDFH